MSGSCVVPYTPRQKKPPTQSVIDAVNDGLPPLDYSFLKMTAVEEVKYEDPREFSIKKTDTSQQTTKKSKSKARCIRLNNNNLLDISKLREVVDMLLFYPLALAWIDLSFNELIIVDPVLLEFENLEILYLHGNCIRKLQEVNKLASLKRLRKLTLHGNPVDEEKDYKNYVRSRMPQLLSIDCCRITKADQITASTWDKCENKANKKKKKRDADL